MWRRVVVAVALASCLSQAATAEIQESGVPDKANTAAAAHSSYWSEAGYGTLAVVSNIFYMPPKLLYAGLGLVTGSLVYVLSVGNSDLAQGVWSPSLGGTYVVTPSMLRGDDEILFIGAGYSND